MPDGQVDGHAGSKVGGQCRAATPASPATPRLWRCKSAARHQVRLSRTLKVLLPLPRSCLDYLASIEACTQ